VHHAHPAATTAKGRLDDQRKANICRDFQRLGPVAHRIFRPRERRNLQLLSQGPRRHLVAHQFEQLSPRPDKFNPGLPAGPRKLCILRKKPIARVHQVDAVFLGNRDDARDIEIRPDGTLAFTDKVRLVRFEPVHRKAVFLRVDRNGPQPQFRGRPKDANGDFRAVGHQKLFLAGWRWGQRRTRNGHGERGVRL